MTGIQGSFNFEYYQNEENNSESSFVPILKEYLLEKKFESEENQNIPVSIFRKGISPLRAVIKFLKENKDYSFSRISKIINRNPRTIWTEYEHVKSTERFSKRDISSETIYIGTVNLAKRRLAPLEAISMELKLADFSNKEISLLLNKSQKTIWTVINRAEKKLTEFENSLNSREVVFK